MKLKQQVLTKATELIEQLKQMGTSRSVGPSAVCSVLLSVSLAIIGLIALIYSMASRAQV